MKELVSMIMIRMKEVQETIELKSDTIHIEQATLKLTTRDNGISIHMLRTIFRQNNISRGKRFQLHT